MTEENIVIKAMNFAVEKHKGQMYGQHPYSKHLHDVAWKAEELWGVWAEKLGLKEEYKNVVLAVCYLHDVLEDTDTHYDEISSMFGEELADDVWFLTKTRRETQETYLQGVVFLRVSRYVKICDTLCNLEQSMKDADGRRIRKYAKQLAILVEGLE